MAEPRAAPRSAPPTDAEWERFERELVRILVDARLRRAKMPPVRPKEDEAA